LQGVFAQSRDATRRGQGAKNFLNGVRARAGGPIYRASEVSWLISLTGAKIPAMPSPSTGAWSKLRPSSSGCRARNRIGLSGGRASSFEERRCSRATDLPVRVADFGWLAVAWGLSYLPNEIGDILPPSAIDDVPVPTKAADLTDRFVSKDLV
jgi:hypothetical protein